MLELLSLIPTPAPDSGFLFMLTLGNWGKDLVLATHMGNMSFQLPVKSSPTIESIQGIRQPMGSRLRLLFFPNIKNTMPNHNVYENKKAVIYEVSTWGQDLF